MLPDEALKLIDYAAGGGVNNAPSGFATAVGDGATTTGTTATAYGSGAIAKMRLTVVCGYSIDLGQGRLLLYQLPAV